MSIPAYRLWSGLSENIIVMPQTSTCLVSAADYAKHWADGEIEKFAARLPIWSGPDRRMALTDRRAYRPKAKSKPARRRKHRAAKIAKVKHE